MHLHICDDHPLIIKSLTALFEDSAFFSEISFSSSKNDLFAQLHNKEADVLILDVNVNGVNMLDEIENITCVAPKMKILVLTSYDVQWMLRNALKLGVHAYLNKNTDEHELFEAVRTILNGEIYVSKGNKRLFEQKDNFQLSQELSEREREVIRLLLQGNPNKRISEVMKISVTTVQTHRRNIYKKLNLKGIGELMSFAVEQGLY
jgi:DNA-binding NarL/FixJ family response regulator